VGSLIRLGLGSRKVEAEEVMTWNPSVRQVPIIATAKPSQDIEAIHRREMECAAAAVISMLIARGMALSTHVPTQRVTAPASAWVVRGRIDTVNRWFV